MNAGIALAGATVALQDSRLDVTAQVELANPGRLRHSSTEPHAYAGSRHTRSTTPTSKQLTTSPESDADEHEQLTSSGLATCWIMLLTRALLSSPPIVLSGEWLRGGSAPVKGRLPVATSTRRIPREYMSPAAVHASRRVLCCCWWRCSWRGHTRCMLALSSDQSPVCGNPPENEGSRGRGGWSCWGY